MMDSLLEKQSKSLEQKYVKSTYEAIAADFSSTRYKKWPKVDAFLRSLPTDTLLLDLGCGNGKYLNNSGTYNIGCDLSSNLLKICRTQGFEVVLCDMTRLPFRAEVFDCVICIAALHHLTTSIRRQRCLTDIVGLLDPRNSQCLIQVWSFEQQYEKDNPYLGNKKHSPVEMVDRSSAPKVVVDSQIELLVHKNRTPFVEQDVLVPFQIKSQKQGQQFDDTPPYSQQKLRYYHVFREGELDSMFKQIPTISILQSYHDKGNWSIVAGKRDAIIESEIKTAS